MSEETRPPAPEQPAPTAGDRPVAGRRHGWIVAVAVLAAAVGLSAFLMLRSGSGSALAPPADRIEGMVEAGRFDQAIVEINEFVEAHPEREPEALYLQGRIAMGRGATYTAAQLYGRAVEADPAPLRGQSVIYDDMVRALSDVDCAVRAEAAKTLALLGEPRAVEPLQEALRADAERPAPPHADVLCHFDEAAKRAIEQLSAAR